MPGPEAKVERQCVREARDRGWRVFKLRFLDQVGAPDRLFGKKGRRLVLVEFKAPGKRSTAIQAAVQGWLRDIGFRVWEVSSVEDFRGRMGWLR